MISTLVLAAADEVHDQDDDDQSGEGGANGNRDDVVGDPIRVAAFHQPESVFLGSHERLNPEIDGGDDDVDGSSEIEDHVGVAGVRVTIVRLYGLDAIFGRQRSGLFLS